jgi:thioredoxin reductase (NADPH)
VLTHTIVTQLFGHESLEAIELKNTETGRTSVVPTDFLIHRLGVEPNTELLRGQLSLDRNGYCDIDARCETSRRHVFAIGDVANPLAPTISGAIGMGATALKTIYETLRHRSGTRHP